MAKNEMKCNESRERMKKATIKDKRVHKAKKKSQAKANCSVDEIKTFQG